MLSGTPMTKTAKIGLLAVASGVAVALVPFFLPTGPSFGDQATGLLESGRIFVAVGLIFLAGLGTACTPCVYPLIPITVGVFGARQAESRGKAALLTTSYVVGMGIVFSALGVTAAMSGKAFGSALGHPAVAIGLAVFLCALAASMFGAFELALPAGLTQKLSQVGGGGLVGALLMGGVSGFLAAPCTGPVLAGLLAYVAKTQNAPVGAGLLFIYAMGIGLPFFLIGVFAMRLPKGGEWMEWVKSIFGIALLGLAAMYVRDAFAAARGGMATAAAQLGSVPGAWIAGLAVALGCVLGAVHLTFKGEQSEFLRKALAVAMVVVALVLRAGALNAPAEGVLWAKLGLTHPQDAALAWDFKYAGEGGGVGRFDGVLAHARAEHRPVMIDFGADWCAACMELERETYVAPQVVQASKCFTNVKVDGTNEGREIDTLYQRYGVEGLPTVIFVAGDGRVLDHPRITGFLPPERFLAEMERVPELTSGISVCSR
jgi:thiol:disulfide interchange protein DsbD